jgi:hypothetical protein
MSRTTQTLLLLLLLCLSQSASAETRAERADRIRKEAKVSFTGQYEVACPPATVKAAMERPLMMAALWNSFAYSPAYQVFSLGEPNAVHVVDPTGIVAEILPVPAPGNRLVYLGEGKVNHWAVPALNRGAAVFDVTLAPGAMGTQVTISIAVKPESPIAGAALWVTSPVVRNRINQRVTNNISDAGEILERIATEPTAVARRLRGDARREFGRAFRR